MCWKKQLQVVLGMCGYNIDMGTMNMHMFENKLFVENFITLWP